MLYSTFQPSRLTLSSGRILELQLIVPLFTLRLVNADGSTAGKVEVKASELERVFMDLKPLFLAPLRMFYSNRAVVIEVNGRIWDRVPDGEFMQLKQMSCAGHGEAVAS